jgi:DNA polymerase III epsilon subunit-like protein
MARKATNERLVFFDLEMAQLKNQSSIIQIAAIAVDSELKERETFETKIRFDVSTAQAKGLPKNSFEPTVWKRLAQHPEKAASDFARFLRRHATVDCVSRAGRHFQVARLVAHNAAFDGPKIFGWYKNMGMFLPAAHSVFCTLQRAYWLFEEDKTLTPPKNYKLATLCEYAGIELTDNQAHDALADVRATVSLYQKLYEQTYFEEVDEEEIETALVSAA